MKSMKCKSQGVLKSDVTAAACRKLQQVNNDTLQLKYCLDAYHATNSVYI